MQKMADDILPNIACEILTKLGCVALREIAAASGYEAEVERLRGTINTIKALLLDAEDKQLESHPVRCWLERLKDALYDADDLLDELVTVASRNKAVNGNKLAKKVKIFFSDSNPIIFAISISQKIKKIREGLDQIAQDGHRFAFKLFPYVETSVAKRQERETHSFVLEEEIIGRDDDKKSVLDILYQYQDQDVCVVPIVGIGGLGKTTLAQLVYNDGSVVNCFDLRLWVCVSDNFSVKEIIVKILKSATNSEPQNVELDQLVKLLHLQITGKKYLLVLDDVWNEDVEKWCALSVLLKVGEKGSKILVTTRSIVVAKIMGTIPHPYYLRGLSGEESWTLFANMAFGLEEQDENQELLSIGKEIVRKCANVPLAIRVIGSLLRGKGTREWLNMRGTSLAEMPGDNNHIMAILRLSYYHLSSSLKNCFVYCALFPKDYEIEKETLINLWMAEGLVNPAYEGQSFEDVGEEYFQGLLQRCFFQGVTRDKWGSIKSCRVHDLLHDLAIEVAGVKYKVSKDGEVDFDNKIYYLSFGYSLTSLWKIPSSMLNLRHLRTLYLPVQIRDGSIFNKSISRQLTSSYKHLRVLDLHNLGLTTLPSSIGRLIHLRYLSLSGTSIQALPKSVGKLANLQTLKLNECSRLRTLPTNIRKLTNLRTLTIAEDSIHYMPSGIGILTSLRKLNFFLVNGDQSKSSSARLMELKELNNLSGSLHIKILGQSKELSCEAKEAGLDGKLGLKELHVEGDVCLYDVEFKGGIYEEAVLDGLKPPSNLKSLKISYHGGEKLPSWAVKDSLCTSLPNLIEIELNTCRGYQKVPSFGRLPFLKCLSLIRLDRVEYMESDLHEVPSLQEAPFYPSLQELKLAGMNNLRGWWIEANEGTVDCHRDLEVGLGNRQHQSWQSFPSLSKLCIKGCPKLKSIPLCPTVEDLTLVDVDETLLVLKLAASSAPSSANTITSFGFSQLKSLCISNVEDLISLPKECMSHLSSLQLQAPKLQNSFELGEFFRSSISLIALSFYNCHKLRSIYHGIECLTWLKILVIGECESLDLSLHDGIEDGMPWKALRNLQYLTFDRLPKLVTLPNGLRHLTNLRCLCLEWNRNLEGLPGWVSCFSSLRRMELHYCPKLSCLPEGFHELTSLNRLEIIANGEFTKRCQPPNGEDWPKIQHIPFVIVKECHVL